MSQEGFISRRSILIGGLVLFAAPAIVRATSLMPIRAWKEGGRNIYVNAFATGLGNGTSWKDAFTNFTEAISHSGPEDSLFISDTFFRSEKSLVFPERKLVFLTNCRINLERSS